MTDFPRPSKDSRSQAIPSCSSARLLIYPMPWLHSPSLWFDPFHIFHQLCAMTITIFLFPCFAFGHQHSLPIQILLFSRSRFPETPRILKVELELDDGRCRVDFSSFKFHFVVGRGFCPSLSATSCCVTLLLLFLLVSGQRGVDLPSFLSCYHAFPISVTLVWSSSS